MCSSLLAIFAWSAVHICHRKHDSDDFSIVIFSNVFISLHSNRLIKRQTKFLENKTWSSLTASSTCDGVRFPGSITSRITESGYVLAHWNPAESSSWKTRIPHLGQPNSLQSRFVEGRLLDAGLFRAGCGDLRGHVRGKQDRLQHPLLHNIGSFVSILGFCVLGIIKAVVNGTLGGCQVSFIYEYKFWDSSHRPVMQALCYEMLRTKTDL